jgi:hypothetical protein
MPPLARLESGEGVDPAVRCASPPVIHDGVPAGLKIKTLTKNEFDIKKIPLKYYEVFLINILITL